jgi:nicotinamidase-related amidase
MREKEGLMTEWKLVGRPALLLVHMQNAICKAPSPIEAMGHCRATQEDGIIPNIQALQKAFREKGQPVIFVCTYTPDDTKYASYGGFWTGGREIIVNRMGTRDVEVIDELAPMPGERVFYNWPFDIFRHNDLRQYLIDKKVETVVVTGVATGMSVGHAAFVLADRFYSLIVPSDTCTDGNRELHEAIMKWMIPAIALVTTSQDVIAHL